MLQILNDCKLLRINEKKRQNNVLYYLWHVVFILYWIIILTNALFFQFISIKYFYIFVVNLEELTNKQRNKFWHEWDSNFRSQIIKLFLFKDWWNKNFGLVIFLLIISPFYAQPETTETTRQKKLNKEIPYNLNESSYCQNTIR